jgi:hypothetical protein
VLGAIGVFIATRLWNSWQCRKGDLTGEWKQYISGESGDKVDNISLKHNNVTKKIKGKIKRLEPQNQRNKVWEFEGVIKGHLLFIIFWTSDVRKNPGSYGTIQLHEINENQLSGFYIRPSPIGDDSEFLNVLIKTSLKWSR